MAKAYNQETLSETEIQYVDYAAWENNFKNKEAYYMQSKYWKRELESPIPLLDIPTDYSRNNERNYACGTEYLELNTELIEGVKRLAQAENTTPFVVLLMAFNILLAKYSSQSRFYCRCSNNRENKAEDRRSNRCVCWNAPNSY